VQQLDDQARVRFKVHGKRADLTGQPYGHRPVACEHRRGQLPERRRDAAGHSGDRAEVQHAEPAARQQQEVARVRISVHPAGACRGRVNRVSEQPGGHV
jgi:hypothetical protein